MANAVVTVLEADGVTETDVTILDVGRQAVAASKSVGLATEDKAVLDAIAASAAILDDAVSGSEMQVDVVTMPAITGTVDLGATDNAVLDAIAASTAASSTAANQATIIGHVDGIESAIASTNTKLDTLASHVDTLETLIASTNTKLDTAITALEIIDNIVAGSEAQVDVLTMPAVDLGATDNAVLDAIAASGAVMDDWDESDRAKVNPIVGQAGIAAGAGAVGATVPRVTLASDDPLVARLTDFNRGEYETVAASQTAQTIGATGAAGDFIEGVLIVPATTSPGNVIILDNATSITIFAGGASSVSNLVPFFVPLGMKSVSGAWKVTTGANVSAIAVGNFT